MTETILNTICNHYKVTREEIAIKNGRRQKMHIVAVKQVASYLLWRYTKLTGTEIAKLLGYPGKQNVNASKRSIKKISEGNHAFKTELELLEKSILRD